MPHRLRDGYDFGPAGLQAAKAAGASLIITCDCGITAVATVAEAAGRRDRGHRYRSPPARPRAAAGPGGDRSAASGRHLRRRFALRDRGRLQAGPGPGPRTWPASQSPVPPARPRRPGHRGRPGPAGRGEPGPGEVRAPAHGPVPLARHPRAPATGPGSTGGSYGPATSAFCWAPGSTRPAGSVMPADGLRLLLTDDEAEAASLAGRLEALNEQRQALDQRILDEALEQVEERLAPDGPTSLVLASDDWHPGCRRHRGVAGGGALRAAHVPHRLRWRSRQRFRPERLRPRPPRRAGQLRRPAGAVRRAPHGGGAHHPPGPAGRRSAAGSPRSPGGRSTRRTSARNSGWTSWWPSTRRRMTSSASAATWSRAGWETPRRSSASAASGSAGAAGWAHPHLKGDPRAGRRPPRCHRLRLGRSGAVAGG